MIKIQSSSEGVSLYSSYEHKEQCASIPGGKWNKVLGCWQYPQEALFDIQEVFGKFEAPKDIQETITSLLYRDSFLDAIKKREAELEEHPFLMYHQKQCRAISKYYERFAFFLDTGTGKTITALQIAEDKAIKFLIMCPKSIIKSAWVEDQEKFFPSIKMLPLSRNMSKKDYVSLAESWGLKHSATKDRLKCDLANHAQLYVVNPETFKADLTFIKTLGVQGMFIDESTTVKNPQSIITREITKFADSLDFVYILSGKPAPNNQMDYFSQMRLVDPTLLGNSFFAFRQKYFDSVGYMGYDFKLKPGADKAIANRIARKSIFIRKEDCLDLPEKTYITRRVSLPDSMKKIYKQMETAQLAVLLDGDTVVLAVNKIASLMKLRQLTSGFIIDDGEVTSLSNHKLNELEEVLYDIGDKPVIIWAQFKHEMRIIESMLLKQGKKVVTAYSETKNLDASIKAFKDGEAQYIVAHPKTLKYGVTFVNCNYAVYYSMSHDYEEYYQSHDRNYRKGQFNPCTFIRLVVEDSIDEDIEKSIESKGGAAMVIENLARRVGGEDD